jgi:hypothetical protein
MINFDKKVKGFPKQRKMGFRVKGSKGSRV